LLCANTTVARFEHSISPRCFSGASIHAARWYFIIMARENASLHAEQFLILISNIDQLADIDMLVKWACRQLTARGFKIR